MRFLLPLLLIVGASVGDETDKPKPADNGDTHVILTPMSPSEKGKLGYSKARPVVVETTVPRFLFEIPDFKSKSPLFFRVALGETKGVPFYGAIDKSPAGTHHDLLYIDRNRDLDLTNDGEPVKARVRTFWQDDRKLVEFLNVTIEVPYTIEGKDSKIPYPCVVYYITEKKGLPTTVQVERDGWRQGEVTINKQTYIFAFIDDDCDGNYTTSDTWTLRPAGTDRKDLLGRDATRTMLFPAWSKDEKFMVEIKKVDLMGSKATLRIKPAKETEREYFMRVATAQQSAEERKLKLDPMRPKADQKDKVKWMVGKPVDYVLKIARSPTVNKRVLLDFTAPRCIWCARMNKYTFRDREVVQLTEQFVSAKIQFATADAKKYTVEGTPTYIILNNDGSEIARHAGFLKPTAFAAWLKSALR